MTEKLEVYILTKIEDMKNNLEEMKKSHILVLQKMECDLYQMKQIYERLFGR